MILFLDDDQNRAALAYQRWPKEKRDKTMWCTTAAEAISVLKDYVEVLEEVHLDHDLGGEHWVDSRRPDCGMEVVRWLQNIPKPRLQQYKKIRFVIHSWNFPAAREMHLKLLDLKLHSELIPFGHTKNN
jgi:hypothetical protein